MKRNGLKKDSIPFREVFRNGIKKYTEIGLVLQGARARANITQKALAKKIGVKPYLISKMEHGKKTIDKSMAQRLARALKVGYRVFL